MITTKQFSFNATIESWAFNAGGGSSIAGGRDTTEDATNDSNAGTGTLQARRTGKNKSDGTPYLEWGNGSLTWQDLGVPAGAIVTAVDLDYDYKCSEYTTGAASTVGAAELRDGAGTTLRKTFSTSQGISSTGAWPSGVPKVDGTNQTGLTDASNTAIRLRIGINPKTGNSSSAAVTIRVDWIIVTITYQISTSDERSAKIKGKDATSDTRAAKITGKSSSSSERPAKTKGKTTITSEYLSKTHGISTTNDERGVSVHGKLSSASEYTSKISGKDSAVSDRPAKASGSALTSSERPAKTHGSNLSNSERPAKIEGQTAGVSSERSAKLRGSSAPMTDHSNSAQFWSYTFGSPIRGIADANDTGTNKYWVATSGDPAWLLYNANSVDTSNERSAKITGANMSERSAKITGVTHGAASSISAQKKWVRGEVIGSIFGPVESFNGNKFWSAKEGVPGMGLYPPEPVSSERAAKLEGSTGETDVNDERAAKTTGQEAANSERSAKTAGQAVVNSDRSAKLTGAAPTNNRYWVGGSGNWSDDTNHWAVVSGGAPGTGNKPSQTNDVIVDASSGFGAGGTISLDGAYYSAKCHDFTSVSGHNYTINYVSSDFSIFGSALFEAGLTWGSGTWLYMASTSAGETIEINGSEPYYLSFGDQQGTGNGIGAVWTLQDDLVVTTTIYFENGEFDANDHNVSMNDISIQVAYGKTPTLTMGSGTWDIAINGWNPVVTFGQPFYINAETSHLFIHGSNNLYLYDKVFYDVELDDSYVNIYGSGTFHNLTMVPGVDGTVFDGGAVIKITGDIIPGSSIGNVTILTRNGVGQHVLSRESGVTSYDYLELHHSYADSLVIDARQRMSQGDLTFGYTSLPKRGQTFKPLQTGAVKLIHLLMGVSGSPSSNLRLKIYTDNAGVPDTLLGTADTVITYADIGSSPAPVNFRFASGPTLTAGTTYWMVLETDDPANGSTFTIWATMDAADYYADGKSYYYAAGPAAWYQDDSVGSYYEDWYFEIFYAGTATWYAGSHSSDVEDNDGWIFTDPPVTVNDARDAKITGQDATSSERDAKITGQYSATSERDAKLSGTATNNSERSAKIQGKDTTNSEREAKLTGILSTNSERDAKVSGTATTNSERAAKTAGKDTASDERAVIISGQVATYSERSGKLAGIDTTNSARDAKITGALAAFSERAAKTEGAGTRVTSDRDAKIAGVSTTLSERSAKTTGKDSSASERDAKITGKAAANSERPAKVSGTATANSERNAKVTGSVADNSERDAKLAGQAAANSTRSAKIDGLSTDSSERAAKIEGTPPAFSANSERPAKTAGIQTLTSDRAAKIRGGLAVNDERSAKLTGGIVEISERPAKIYGKFGWIPVPEGTDTFSKVVKPASAFSKTAKPGDSFAKGAKPTDTWTKQPESTVPTYTKSDKLRT